eukprot:2917775-Pyramimonas_sp.AAC.1
MAWTGPAVGGQAADESVLRVLRPGLPPAHPPLQHGEQKQPRVPREGENKISTLKRVAHDKYCGPDDRLHIHPSNMPP